MRLEGHGLRFCHHTDTGRVRPDNQDACHVEVLDPSLPQALLAVADGMGGHAGGEIASRLAVDTVGQAVRSQSGGWRTATDRLNGLRQAGTAARQALLAAQAENPALTGMGTTLTAVLICGDEVSIAHTGDSRCYRVRGQEARRLTDDHSVVGEMLRQGTLSEAEAMVHPQRHLLISALGAGDPLSMDLQTLDWQSGDLLLLCTDGLSNLISAAEIAAAAADPAQWDTLALRLVSLANERGGPDNITAVAAWRVG